MKVTTIVLIALVAWCLISPDGKKTAKNALYLAKTGIHAAVEMIDVSVAGIRAATK